MHQKLQSRFFTDSTSEGMLSTLKA